MNLYKISQNVNDGYDIYDSAIVAALGDEQARRIHPGGLTVWSDAFLRWVWKSSSKINSFASVDCVITPEQVKVELVGSATPGIEAGVILASFNSG